MKLIWGDISQRKLHFDGMVVESPDRWMHFYLKFVSNCCKLNNYGSNMAIERNK